MVLETIKDLESTRRCWRLVGGVLIERNIGEVLPAIKANIDMVSKKNLFISKDLKKVGKNHCELFGESETERKGVVGICEAVERKLTL